MTNIPDPVGDGVTPTSTHIPFPAVKPRAPKVSVNIETESLSSMETPPAIQRAATPPRPEPPLDTTPKTTSQKDADYIPLSFPSQFHFYRFKSASATQIRGRHQAKFARASKHNSTRLVVEAITSMLGDGINAADLTIPDFYALMYWLRINCFGKVTFPINLMCTDPDHVTRVAEEKEKPETLMNSALISQTSLKETLLDTKAVDDFLRREDLRSFFDLGYGLTAPRMSDSIELEEKWADKPEYASVEFLTDLAGAIYSLEGNVLSLEQRIEAVSDMSPEHTAILGEWLDIAQSYGIEESISMRCKGCGAEVRTEVTISASDFL